MSFDEAVETLTFLRDRADLLDLTTGLPQTLNEIIATWHEDDVVQVAQSLKDQLPGVFSLDA